MLRTLAACAALMVCGLTSTTALAADRPPNVVLILSDDLGWGELGCQGNKQIPTPHHDSIAAGGTRFLQGHVAATYCSPSRAGLMTGRYPTRFGHEYNPAGDRETAGLPLSETTMAQRMKELGYATICIGKWHLGEAKAFYPNHRGFDEFYGTLANTSFFNPKLFVDSRKGDEIIKIDDKSFYTTDKYADRACDFIDQNKDKPFFLYLPFNAQHAPLEAPQTYLDRVKPLGITDQKRTLFAAMMIAMDDAIGRVLTKVKEVGQEENTIVWYLADNGGPTESTTSMNGPLRGFKMTTNEGGTRVPFMVKWPGKIPAGKTYDTPILNLDILPTTLLACGGKVDEAWKLDGEDIMPFITGKKEGRPHDVMYWKYGPQWAIQQGDFKLVASRIDALKPRLINLKEDVAEANDISSSEEKRVQEMTKNWESWNKEQQPAKWGGEQGNGVDKDKKKKKKAKD